MTRSRHTIFRWGLLLLFLLPFGLHAQQPPAAADVTAGQTRPRNVAPASAPDTGETTTVDYYGDLMTQRAGDTVLYLIDNVIFHHNGTYIQCDSAKRYDEYHMECFGNVVINKDSTYIYGDRASYDGHTDLAKVYSPLLKLVNGDATMWVFDYMEFNTRTNIGEYNEGAVILQRDNRMESDRGIFNGDSSTITFVGHVAMRNDNYKIRTDSVRYDFDNEIVTFLTKAYIWDKDRDFLTADRGNYVRATETYHFTRNAYAMTADQEFWADTMNYESAIRKVVMRRNIQILDTAQRTIGLGDFGFYNDSLKNGLLTDSPAVILYDEPQAADSAAGRDTLPQPVFPLADTLQIAITDTVAAGTERDTTLIEPSPVPADTAKKPVAPPRPDSAFTRADTILFESYPPGRSKPKPPKPEQPAADTSAFVPAAADSTALPAADSLAADSTAAMPLADALAADSTVAVSFNKDTLPPAENGGFFGKPAIGVEEPPAPAAPDSLVTAGEDSLSAPVSPDSVGQRKDSLERVIRARHRVKMWRPDVQGICDSLTAYSVDSMTSLFGRPLIWNGSSQLAADRIDIYSRNEELDYAEFIGSPFITQQVENADTLFNQAEGRFLQAWFRNNALNRAIMTGNVLNYYYMGDDSLPPDKFAVLSCASLTIDFEDQEPVHMNWGGRGDWHIDPIDKIPAGESQRLPNFSWEPERKPRSRYDITRRTVRPSLRTTVSGYAQPLFPIEDRFATVYDRLLQDGVWRDRSEPLDESRVEKLQGNDLLY